MWDIPGDAFDTFEDVGVLANLSLDQLELEAIVFADDGTKILKRFKMNDVINFVFTF